MQVEHELAERALQSGKLPAQNHETRARELGRRLEIHGGAVADPPGFAQLEMLLAGAQTRTRRLEAVVGAFHVAVLVGADRHVRAGRVRDLGKLRLERLQGRLLAIFQLRHLKLEAGDLVHQRRRPHLVPRLLGGADLLRQAVAAFLKDLQLGDGGPARLVEPDQLVGEGRKPAAREPGVEAGGIVADKADVVHGSACHSGPARSAEPGTHDRGVSA